MVKEYTKDEDPVCYISVIGGNDKVTLSEKIKQSLKKIGDIGGCDERVCKFFFIACHA